MEEKELLDHLSNYLDYFSDVSPYDFFLLEELETEELGLMNEDNYKVINLLKQICDYALIFYCFMNLEDTISDYDEYEDDYDYYEFDDDYDENYDDYDEDYDYYEDSDIDFFEDLEIENCNEMYKVLQEKDDDLSKEILSISNMCYDYVYLLFNKGVKHPSIDNVIAKENISDTCDDIICCMKELTNYFNPSFQNYFLKILNLFDEEREQELTNIYFNIEKDIVNINEFDKKSFMKNLSKYAKDILAVTGLNSDGKNYWNDGTIYVNYVTDNSISKGIERLSILASFFISCKEDTDIEEVLCIIDDLEEAYSIYNTYKYKYLQDKQKEVKMLIKRK